MKQMIYQINSLQELAKLAQQIINNLGPYHIITLSGDLGSGKTAFVQAVAKILNIKNKITSPSFVLTKIYRLPEYNKFNYLYHIDLYRVQKKTNNNLGQAEDWGNPKKLIMVEWPNRLKKIPRQRVDIHIKIRNYNQRIFIVRWLGTK
jgi:tRNA threonylcarbamoyladenosine biosynthesis protein TsaE